MKAVVEIGIDIAVVDGADREAAFDDHLDGPARGGGAARVFSGAVVDIAAIGTVAEPTGVERDAGVVVDRVIAAEVEPEKCG